MVRNSTCFCALVSVNTRSHEYDIQLGVTISVAISQRIT